MTEKDLEYLLLENLKIARENRAYLIKIDARQRWVRNMKALYAAFIVAVVVVAGYFAYPYLKTAWGQFEAVHNQINGMVELVTPVNKP